MSRTADGNALGPALALLALTVVANTLVWWWLGAPMALPPSPQAAGEKLYCVSYAPFRDGQNPLVEGTHVDPAQIDQDLALLSKYTDCIRTYSVENGLDVIPEIAARHGLKVLLGVWLSNHADKNAWQIATVAGLARKFPGVVQAVIVGNEVLLRGEMSVTDLIAAIRKVKSQIAQPVSYADVWEFWLRYRDVAAAVDFVTIHILPYWEDFPIPAPAAAAHVDAIRKQVAAAFPGKDVLIGEVGWPSAGRMREGARPSPWNQASVIEGVLTLAHRENFHVNVIEAFDQPWKRRLEGAVGGHWGIFDRTTQAPKFKFGEAASDHPHWGLLALAGDMLAVLIFAAAFAGQRAKAAPPSPWPKIAALAFLPVVLVGWTLETVPAESFSAGSWLRALAFAATAVVAPLVCATACAAGRPRPTLAMVLRRNGEPRDALTWLVGLCFVALLLLAIESALGLVFDPRYRDIPFAPLTAAVVPFVVLWMATPRRVGARPAAESVAAAVLAASAIYIVFNESFANWQAVWLGAALIALAFILEQARDVPD